MKNHTKSGVAARGMFETLEDRTCMSATFPGGVSVAVGDVNGDSSLVPAVKITDGTSNTLIGLLLPAVQAAREAAR
jgi:hypothetical protein